MYRKDKFTEEEIMKEYRHQIGTIHIIAHEKGTLREMWQGTNLKRSIIVISANISI